MPAGNKFQFLNFSEEALVTDVTRQRLAVLSYKVHEHRLEKAWKRFENAGFKPILIKGWAAAQLYPKPFDRQFNDIDLIINPKEYNAAVDFLNQFDENSNIDLHRCAKTLDNLTFEKLYSHTKTLKCGETNIRVLCAEDHLRVLCVHWLIDGGAKKEKLRDIFYAVQNRPGDFDWDRCLNAAGETRRNWVICAIALTNKYLGLDTKDTPLAVRSATIPPWVINAVEKEWRSNLSLRPLQYCLGDRRELWRQLKKRIPPNPIQATIDMEGEFDNGSRIIYQIGDVFFRLKPSVKRILNLMLQNKRD